MSSLKVEKSGASAVRLPEHVDGGRTSRRPNAERLLHPAALLPIMGQGTGKGTYSRDFLTHLVCLEAAIALPLNTAFFAHPRLKSFP